MAFPLCTFLSLLVLIPGQGFTASSWKLDAGSVSRWQAMPGWLGNPSERASFRVEDKVLHLHVPEPGKGMKWRIEGRPVDARYVVVRYRAINVEPKHDYFIYLDDGLNHGLPYRGINVITLDEIATDDRWHYGVVDLWRERVGPFISSVAVQVQATKRGDAHIWLDFIAFTDRLPEGVEPPIPKPPEGPRIEREISLALLARVRPEPTWLGDPASEGAFSASVEEGALRLEVLEPTKGMKWSLPLPEPVDLRRAPYVVLRYRADGISPSSDYLLYLGSERPTEPEREYHAVKLHDIVPDGKWHTVCVRWKPYRCVLLAFQVQAEDGPARIWIKPILFSSHPVETSEGLRDMLPISLDLSSARIGPPEAKLLDLSSRMNVSLSSLFWGLKEGSRFPTEVVVAEGIPFRVSTSPSRNVAEAPKPTGYLEIPIGEKACEVYLVLALRLPVVDEPSYGGGGIWRITRPHRVHVEIEYDDGRIDRCLPYRIASGKHEVVEKLDAYCVPADPSRVIRAVRVWDGLPVGSVGVCAVTLNLTEKKLFPEASSIPPPFAMRPLTLPKPMRPKAKTSGFKAFVENAYLRLDLSTGKGLTVEGVEIPPLRGKALVKPSPLFEVELEGRRMTSADYKVERAEAKGGNLSFTLSPPPSKFPSVSLTIEAEREPILTFSVKLTNLSDSPIRLHLRFFSTLPFRIGDDDWYLYPAKAAVLSRKPCNFRLLYGGAFPLQFLSLFNPSRGFGLYALVKDNEGLTKRFILSRSPSGETKMGVEFMPDPIPPGSSYRAPSLDLGLTSGDWHGAFEAYKRWVETWYRPLLPRKRWFREVFFFRQDYLREGLLDFKRGVYRFERKIEIARRAFGGCDYLHIFDWGACGRRGRTGDYNPWGEIIPGPEEFRRAVEKLQGNGVPVGLYIEGYLVDHRSDVGRAHLEEWGMRDTSGKLMPYTPGCPEFIMCPMVKAWQEYLAGVYRRVSSETGALGFYIDEFGFAGRFCRAKGHGHPVPCHVLRGERELTRRIRLALPSKCVVYTEETPCDVNSQCQDGSFTYCVNAGQTWLRPYLEVPLKLFRFAFPDFKTFEIITCDRPTGSNVEAVKQVFFNGEGLWIQGEPESWFTKETRETIRKCMGLLRAHKEAIASENVNPFVPTLVGRVFANEFKGKRESVWLLYNANPLTVRGPVLSVQHIEGTRYFDLWNGREIKPAVEGGKAVISLEIGPHDVGMVVRRQIGSGVPSDLIKGGKPR